MGCKWYTHTHTHSIPFHFHSISFPLRIHTHPFQMQSIVFTRNPILSFHSDNSHQWIWMRWSTYLHLNYMDACKAHMECVCYGQHTTITTVFPPKTGFVSTKCSTFIFTESVSDFATGKNDQITTISKQRQTMSFMWLHLMLSFADNNNDNNIATHTHNGYLSLYMYYWIWFIWYSNRFCHCLSMHSHTRKKERLTASHSSRNQFPHK